MGHYFFFFSFVLSLFFIQMQRSNCETLVVDGLSHLSNSTAHIGDTIIFKHKNEYNVYIFRSKEAFSACNFTQATSLSDPNSTTYTWHASRPGLFYFSFFNGTNKPCQQGLKLAVQISPPGNHATPPESLPPASHGGTVSSSPSFQWPFQPREKSGSGLTSNPIGGVSNAPADSPEPAEKEGSIPFISSNPAVPLPSGEVDSDTIRPSWPLTVNHAPNQGLKMVGFTKVLINLCGVIILML